MKGAATNNNLVLINASGSIMKNKSSVKDGDDWYYSTNKYGVVTAIASDKDYLDPKDENHDKCIYTNTIED